MQFQETGVGASRLLILFAVWAPNASEDTVKTLDWYKKEVLDRFPSADKIVAINHGSDRAMLQGIIEAPGVIATVEVEEAFAINSDAAPYQAAMRHALPILANYETVLFVHTKGVSYSFEAMEDFRRDVSAKFFSNPGVVTPNRSENEFINCFCAHMDCYRGSISHNKQTARQLGLTEPLFNFAATFTMYSCSARTLYRLLNALNPEFLNAPIASWGGNRFLMEGLFPSMLVTIGAELRVLGGDKRNYTLNENISYSCDPSHTSYVALIQYERFKTDPNIYDQPAIPYIFGLDEVVTKATVAYSN